MYARIKRRGNDVYIEVKINRLCPYYPIPKHVSIIETLEGAGCEWLTFGELDTAMSMVEQQLLPMDPDDIPPMCSKLMERVREILTIRKRNRCGLSKLCSLALLGARDLLKLPHDPSDDQFDLSDPFIFTLKPGRIFRWEGSSPTSFSAEMSSDKIPAYERCFSTNELRKIILLLENEPYSKEQLITDLKQIVLDRTKVQVP